MTTSKKDPKTASTEISADIKDTAAPRPPKSAAVPAGISCAICLNQKGDRVQADTIVKGYATCAQHVELVSRPNFDIFQMKTTKSFT